MTALRARWSARRAARRELDDLLAAIDAELGMSERGVIGWLRWCL